mgnify:CR=1 FL=1
MSDIEADNVVRVYYAKDEEGGPDDIPFHDVLRQIRGYPLRSGFCGQIQQQFGVCLA